MISVEEALSRLFGLIRPVGTEVVELRQAAGRVLTEPAFADRDQPPFVASAMDGYAARTNDVHPGARLRCIGTAAAGSAYAGSLDPGQTVRIFTGAPVPKGADRIVIQEDVTVDGDFVTLGTQLDSGPHIRAAGTDFASGSSLSAPRRLGAVDLARLAAMNVPAITVARRPGVALIATGNELVMPGENPRPDQIIASNGFALAAMIEAEGGTARMLPIARDTDWALDAAFEMAADADLIVTIGGASVGDHDLVGDVAARKGFDQAFYKIAMRPGKPLIAGRLGVALMIGLPGNPVSSIVCGHVFLLPMLRAMQGLPAEPAPRGIASLAAPLAPNGPREHYMRAKLVREGITAFDRQDSSLLSVLSEANALLIRPAGDPARITGETAEYILL